MAQHECSICLEEVSQTTGLSTMACGHCFHIGCLARWLIKNESCPYCRHEANEQERVEEDKEEDESTEYESDDDEEDGDARDEDQGENWVRVSTGHWITLRPRNARVVRLEIPEFDEEAHAFWVFRKTMEIVESGEDLMVQKELTRPEVNLPQVRYSYRDHLHLPHDDGYETN